MIEKNNEQITSGSAPKKNPAMPVMIGVLAVLLVAAVAAFIFKEEIVGSPDKNTSAPTVTQSSSASGVFPSGSNGEASVSESVEETGISSDTETAETEKATQAPVTKPQEQVATEAVTTAATKPSVVTKPAAETSAVKTEHKDELPQTKEEIVAYFNTSINNAKANSKSITSNYKTNSVIGAINGPAGTINLVVSIAEGVIKSLGGEKSQVNVTWSSAADKNANFPVAGETWASKLTASDVKSARIVENNGKIIITITTVADSKSDNPVPNHASKVFNVVSPDKISIPENCYPSGTIELTVDAATGNAIHANYTMYWTFFIYLNEHEHVIPFVSESDYTINW